MKTKPKHKKTTVVSLLMAWCLLFSLSLSSQVTIGAGTPPQDFSILEIVSNGTGGLRLPQLTTTERNALTDASFKADPLAEGLTIYNTTTKCVEYWNATRWVSLCEGTSQMIIGPDPCDNVAADGSGCDKEFTVTDPDCVNGPFSFAVVGGSGYASLYDVDEKAGSFRVAFEANNSTKDRTVIVRVTSGCTGLYKDFLFMQKGQSCDTSLGTAPAITSVPSGKNISFCAGGAVYLSVPSTTANLDQLIWTRNNVEIARGVSNITVTQAGVYDVWMGIIGCKQQANNAVTVTRDGTGAPSPVNIVVTGNNGLVCDPTSTTKLIALKASSGTVRWFKDGALQTESSPDNEIEAGVGQWFAVVNDGTCWSAPSETVTVSVDPNAGTSLTEPVIETGGNFCAGGSVQLRVDDFSYNPAYTYTWFENNNILGTGRDCLYRVPTGATNVVIRCRATLVGSCAAEAISTETITTGTIPAPPTITGDRQLCSGQATLNAVASGAGTFTYRWFKDNVPYADTQSISVNEGGEYSVTVTDGCTSPAASITIAKESSAAPTVTLNKSSDSPNLNDVVTYNASINFGPATGYVWTVNNATLQSGGTGNAFAVVKFDQAGAASVKVEVSNACGTGSATHSIANVGADCVPPASVSPSADTNLTAIKNSGVTLGPVTATFSEGAPMAAYQWYSNTTASTTGGAAISGATNKTYVATNTAVGTYYYYCVVKNSCQAAGDAGLTTGLYTVVVSDPGSNPAGVGTFTGKTCFDVVESNDGGSCGSIQSRQTQRVDFTSTNTQTYTFTTSGSVSKIRFFYEDLSGSVIESIDYDKSIETGINLSGSYTLTVTYKTTLNNDQTQGGAGGRDRDNALKATLYAVYNSNPSGEGGTANDKRLELKISVQDCICCPGYLSVGGEYTQNYDGALANTTTSQNIANLSRHFTATGKDVCVYMTEVTWVSNSENELYCRYNYAIAIEHRFLRWRLPNIAELGALQYVGYDLAIQPNSAPGTTNMRSVPGYWSINWSRMTGNGQGVIWYAKFGPGGASANTATRLYDKSVRCVATF